MTHYDVLGVPRGATHDELRRAYLALARAHHPDHHAGSTDAERTAAERRMRAINEAWRDIGDPERRRRYDEQLDRGPTAATVEEEPARTWRPFDGTWDLDPDDLDERLDDSDARRPAAARLLAVGPAAALVVGLATAFLGLITQIRAVLALGFIGIAIGVLLFLAAPLAVILDSRRHDRL
ncbi:MAG: DnaJ domain-containing protein [Acidimicrobiia bacterium]|nr:DnaJ domain-containing protein [Acidimicrobiia bacterium]